MTKAQIEAAIAQGIAAGLANGSKPAESKATAAPAVASWIAEAAKATPKVTAAPKAKVAGPPPRWVTSAEVDEKYGPGLRTLKMFGDVVNPMARHGKWNTVGEAEAIFAFMLKAKGLKAVPA